MPMTYKGWVSINSIAVPCNTSGLDLTPSPQFSENVHRHGWVINYADGQNAYEGTIEIPINNAILATIKTWVTTADQNYSVLVSADGLAAGKDSTWTYANTYLRSITLNGNAGGIATASLDLVAKTRTAAGSAPTFTATAGATDQTNPIPYWKTSLEYNGSTGNFGGSGDATQVTAWSLTAALNPVVLYYFNGSQDPGTIQTGTMDVTGSATIYNESGTVIPSNGQAGVLTLDSVNGVTWTLGYFVFPTHPQGISGPNEKATRALTFRVLGDVSTAPIS